MRNPRLTGVRHHRYVSGRVVIIGGGAAGTAAFVALVRHRAAGSIDVVDPRPPGGGVVFGAAGPGLLCNTSAGVMSLDPADPNGFVRYLRASGVPATPDDFVPRELVGRYCGDAFREHATGFHPPALSCGRHELRLDTAPIVAPRVEPDLRLRFPRGTAPERIWLLGTASYQRVPIVNYLRTAVDQADSIARLMAARALTRAA